MEEARYIVGYMVFLLAFAIFVGQMARTLKIPEISKPISGVEKIESVMKELNITGEVAIPLDELGAIITGMEAWLHNETITGTQHIPGDTWLHICMPTAPRQYSVDLRIRGVGGVREPAVFFKERPTSARGGIEEIEERLSGGTCASIRVYVLCPYAALFGPYEKNYTIMIERKIAGEYGMPMKVVGRIICH